MGGCPPYRFHIQFGRLAQPDQNHPARGHSSPWIQHGHLAAAPGEVANREQFAHCAAQRFVNQASGAFKSGSLLKQTDGYGVGIRFLKRTRQHPDLHRTPSQSLSRCSPAAATVLPAPAG